MKFINYWRWSCAIIPNAIFKSLEIWNSWNIVRKSIYNHQNKSVEIWIRSSSCSRVIFGNVFRKQVKKSEWLKTLTSTFEQLKIDGISELLYKMINMCLKFLDRKNNWFCKTKGKVGPCSEAENKSMDKRGN